MIPAFLLPDTRVRMKGPDLTGRFISALVLQILAYAAQTERENIRRQAEGIAAAKAAGKRWGRPAFPRLNDADPCAALWRSGQVSLEDLPARRDAPRSAAHFFIKKHKQNKKTPDFFERLLKMVLFNHTSGRFTNILGSW